MLGFKFNLFIYEFYDDKYNVNFLIGDFANIIINWTI